MDRREAEMIAAALEARVTTMVRRDVSTDSLQRWEALARKYRQIACQTTPAEEHLLAKNAKLSRAALKGAVK